MKATVLVDNIKNEELGAAGQWGLAVYIEHNDKKILVDTGSDGLFLENAKKLGVALDEVGFAVLSHAHYDHGGGMKEFFEHIPKAKMYLQKACGEDCYRKLSFFGSRYIGLPKNILQTYDKRIGFVEGKTQLCEGTYLLSHSTPGLNKLGKRDHMYRKIEGKLRPDDFSHEQSLVLDTKKGLVIINSCSHAGVSNIIREVREAFPDKNVYGIIGGFHLFDKSKSFVRRLGKEIKDIGISYVCTGHCTGKKAYKILEGELGDTLQQLRVGLEIEI